MATVQENIEDAERILNGVALNLNSSEFSPSLGTVEVKLATAYAGLAAVKLTAEALETNRVAMDRMATAAEEY